MPAGSSMEALFLTADGASMDEAVGPLPELPVPVNYPQYTSMALLPLVPPGYEAQVTCSRLCLSSECFFGHCISVEVSATLVTDEDSE